MQVREFLYFSFIGFLREPKSLFLVLRQNWFFSKGGYWFYVITLLVAFVGNAAFAYFNDRFFPDGIDNKTYNFLEDIPNIINYLFVCPAYVSAIAYYITRINRLPTKLDRGLLSLINTKRKSLGLSWWGKLLWAIAYIIMLILPVLLFDAELDTYDRIFWFESVEGRMSLLGTVSRYYYQIMNAVFLVLWLAIVYKHIIYLHISLVIGRALNRLISKPVNESTKWAAQFPKSRKDITKLFDPIIDQYLVSKLLIILATINLYTWKAQQPQYSGALDLTILVLALAGMLLISFPRYQLQYYIKEIRKLQNESSSIDIRGKKQVGWANLLDVIIFGSAFTNLVLYALRNLGLDVTRLF